MALPAQYRMAEEIMALSNTLIYRHTLRCGAPHIARASLQVRWWAGWVGGQGGQALHLDPPHTAHAKPV